MEATMRQPAVAPSPQSITEIQVLIAQLYTNFMELLKAIARRGDISPVQAFTLLKMGDEAMRTGDVMLSGAYMGTNETHNIGGLVKMGYLRKKKSNGDHRVVLINITAAGKKRRKIIQEELERALDGSVMRLQPDLAIAAPILKQILRSNYAPPMRARR